jgi:hypothetical protein
LIIHVQINIFHVIFIEFIICQQFKIDIE